MMSPRHLVALLGNFTAAFLFMIPGHAIFNIYKMRWTIIKGFYILGASSVEIVVILSFLFYDTNRERSEFIGVLCAFVSVITFCIPFGNIVIVQPPWASFIIFLNGSVWFWYAILDGRV